jgi:hypothetical protein
MRASERAVQGKKTKQQYNRSAYKGAEQSAEKQKYIPSKA